MPVKAYLAEFFTAHPARQSETQQQKFAICSAEPHLGCGASTQ